MLKILVVIANFGTKNDVFLRRIIDEYRSFSCEVDIVVLTNVPKAVDGATEVIVHRPEGHPWTFPFAHKAILASRVNHYDLFIYTEDDTLITQENIDAFLRATEPLQDDEIAGFLRTETAADGQLSVSTINGHFRWDPTQVVKRGNYTFAYFTNEHSASYLLTREQLHKAIHSGGFLVPPHQEKYDLLVTAATDPYTQCGFRKLICISHIECFLISHLPNKYLGQFGVDYEELKRQVVALKEIQEGSRPPTVLFRTETKLQHQQWSRRFYDTLSQDIATAIGKNTRSLLSFGCGTGALEADLKALGLKITAVPLDSVIGACAEARGLDVAYGDAVTVWKNIDSRRFDCILAPGILHLIPEPSHLLRSLSGLLADNGRIVASVPNILRPQTRIRQLTNDPSVTGLGSYDQSGVHACSFRTITRWYNAAGLTMHSAISTSRPNGSTAWWMRASARLFPRLFAVEFLITASKTHGEKST